MEDAVVSGPTGSLAALEKGERWVGYGLHCSGIAFETSEAGGGAQGRHRLHCNGGHGASSADGAVWE